MFRARLGVRARILTIALIPSLTLLLAGVGISSYLINGTQDHRRLLAAAQQGTDPTHDLIVALQNERRLTLAHLTGDQRATDALAAVRPLTMQAMQAMVDSSADLRALAPDTVGNEDIGGFATLQQQFGTVRSAADNRVLPVADAYTFYSRLMDVFVLGAGQYAELESDAAVRAEMITGQRLMQALDSSSRTNALTESALRSGGPVALVDEYRAQTGYHRVELARLAETLDGEPRERLRGLLSSAQWQLLQRAERTVLDRSASEAAGSGRDDDPTTAPPGTAQLAEWQAAAEHVDRELLDIWWAHSRVYNEDALDAADNATIRALLFALALMIIAIVAFGTSLILANRFIRRLYRLRDQTLALADERLPAMLARIRQGEEIEDSEGHADLDFGHDEIGSVATAFEHAHAVAVAAAVHEARTQEGVKAIFLNIAHRSQIVVHKQLEILDEAERREEDPAMLDTLFKLDHLATRERRNAENLTILGGGKPGRQWRAPVPLVDLVRSAVGETLDYARVRVGRIPEHRIAGNAVGDLIHLLAELVDNATSFSPPQSRVEVTASVIGKGIALEITDQGMGIPEETREQFNELLRNPPDFDVTTLQKDSRLGLFVVARLAARHGITVRLRESDYSGIRAVVIVPSDLLTEPGTEPVAQRDLPRAPQRALESAGNDPEPNTAGAPATSFAAAAAQSTGTATLLADPPTEHVATPGAAPEPTPEPTAAPEPEPQAALLPDGRPALPRRSRQAKVTAAKEDSGAPPETAQPPAARPRSAEHARDLMAAIEQGTRQGRRPLPADDPGTLRLRSAGRSPDEQEN